MAPKRKRKRKAYQGDDVYVDKWEQRERRAQRQDNDPIKKATDIGQAMMRAKMGYPDLVKVKPSKKGW